MRCGITLELIGVENLFSWNGILFDGENNFCFSSDDILIGGEKSFLLDATLSSHSDCHVGDDFPDADGDVALVVEGVIPTRGWYKLRETKEKVSGQALIV